MSIILNQGEEKRSINLETAQGNPIDNNQFFSISSFERSQFQDYSLERYPSVIFRNNPSPIYNCHGKSFASGRTNIYNSNEIRKIIRDDRYIKLELKEVKPGDIVLYISNIDGDIIHSGLIVTCEVNQNDLPHIVVVSKWGKFKEAKHNLYDCPYHECYHEFYRVDYAEYSY